MGAGARWNRPRKRRISLRCAGNTHKIKSLGHPAMASRQATLYGLNIMSNMAAAKPSRRKQASAMPARKERSPRLQGRDLRRALEEIRDTKSETRAQELKKAISDSICRV